MKCLVAILLSSLILIHSDARYIKRDTKVTESKKSLCSKTTPCGWMVYEPYVKTPLYFLKSPCDCHPEERCEKSSDDISISAYVYLCSRAKQS